VPAKAKCGIIRSIRIAPAGIPLFTIDAPSQYSLNNTTSDNVATGKALADQLIKDAGGKGKILVFNGFYGVPVCAIGGITPENGGGLVTAGADMLAVVDGLFGAADVEAQARRYAALWASRNGWARP
jgi:hypothetical protein